MLTNILNIKLNYVQNNQKLYKKKCNIIYIVRL